MLKATAIPSRVPVPTLLRSLRKWELAAVAMNGVIGAGIFGLPSRAFGLAGPWSLAAFAGCAVLTSLIVLCFAEVSSRFSDTGGPYLYAREAFGPTAGFTVGWLLWLARLTAFAANCNLLLDYASYFWPPAGAMAGRLAAATITVGALLAINIAGVRGAAVASNWLTGAKVTCLALFAGCGLFFVQWDRLAPAAAPEMGAFSTAVLLLMYAFTGFEMAAIPAGEAKDPRSSIPPALIVAVGGTACLYIFIQAVCIGTVTGLADSQRPLADAATQFLGPIGAGLISALALVSIAGNLNVVLLSGARLPFAMAERGELPRFLAAAHVKFRTPHAALLTTAVIMLVLTVSGTFVYAVTISALSRLVAYLSTCLAMLAFRSRPTAPPAAFQLRGGPIFALCSTALISWLLLNSTWREARDTAIAAGLGLLIYAIRRLSTARVSI